MLKSVPESEFPIITDIESVLGLCRETGPHRKIHRDSN